VALGAADEEGWGLKVRASAGSAGLSWRCLTGAKKGVSGMRELLGGWCGSAGQGALYRAHEEGREGCQDEGDDR
jgi:hypothetical protein